MAEVVVSAVRTRRDRSDFFQLPWELYRHDPNWIPPLQQNQKQLLGWKYHPFQKIAEMDTFVARRGSTVCGRVAVILNHEHNRVQRDDRGFFGFFDCRDDQEAANALFDAARAWLAERNITKIRGPANPSMNYECGLLIEGFDSPPTFMMTYNPPYYAHLIEEYGFRKTHDLLAYMGELDQLPEVRAKLEPLFKQVIERTGVELRHMDRNRFMQEVELFLDTYNRACVNMWGFVPFTAEELRFTAKSLKHLLVPEMALAADVEGKTIGCVLGLPDFNPVIKKINGRLFPFGVFRILAARRKLSRIRIISIDVVPEFQRWGIGLVLMGGLVPEGLKLGFKEAEFSWISEANDLARMGLEKGGAKLVKKYRIYDYAPAETTTTE